MLRLVLTCAFIAFTLPILAEDPKAHPPLELLDVFELESAHDPQISPDGSTIVYVRHFFDIEDDRTHTRIWSIDVATGRHRPLLGDAHASSPRWSPSGDRLAYLLNGQIHVLHLDGARESFPVTRTRKHPGELSWSPDGTQIAFSLSVPESSPSWGTIPKPPEGAKWAKEATVIDRLVYRRDGSGYVKGGHRHVFVVPATGGTARQLTDGAFNHSGTPTWSRDGKTIYTSANRNDGWEYETNESEVWAIDVQTGAMSVITDRRGPDESPLVSPDGKWLAVRGHDDSPLGYRHNELAVRRLDGTETRTLTTGFDRSVGEFLWHPDSNGLFVQFDEEGETKIGFFSLDGKSMRTVATGLGGTTLGRPYSSGSFSVSQQGTIAATIGTATRPSDVALISANGNSTVQLTQLNEDLLGQRTLGRVEEIRVPSTFDGKVIHGWVVYPPTFDPEKKYPLVLEIHGGPFANYGPRFSAEMQLYAAAGNVVLYTNPRGSTSYGADFANLIHHAYPGNDYDDLISCVDAVIRRGFIDTRHLFVTGGSGGGVLTAWIVGKTDRFRAAVVAKPVIHWTSFVLTADYSNYFTKYWFPAPPWEIPEHYWARSPLSLVGNVTTPTMLLTGEEDYRTPMSETEQYYQALKLRKIDTAMVRIPGAGHGITRRPSNLVRKVAYIQGWFDKHSDVP